MISNDLLTQTRMLARASFAVSIALGLACCADPAADDCVEIVEQVNCLMAAVD